MNRRLAAGVGQLAAKLALKTASSMKDVLETLARMERALAEGRGAEKRDVAEVAAAFRLDVGQLAAAMHGDFEKMQRGVAAIDQHVLQADRHVQGVGVEVHEVRQMVLQLLQQ